MRNFLLSVACIIGIAVVTVAATREPPAVKEMRDAIKASLKRPDAADFRNWKIRSHYVCGEMNAQNSYGDYTGFKRFFGDINVQRDATRPHDIQSFIIERDWYEGVDASFDKLFREACGA